MRSSVRLLGRQHSVAQWRELPSWFVIGEEDRIIPAEIERFMAERAGARRMLEIPGASHALSVSQPRATVDLILEAATVCSRLTEPTKKGSRT